MAAEGRALQSSQGPAALGQTDGASGSSALEVEAVSSAISPVKASALVDEVVSKVINKLAGNKSTKQLFEQPEQFSGILGKQKRSATDNIHGGKKKSAAGNLVQALSLVEGAADSSSDSDSDTTSPPRSPTQALRA